MVRHSTAIRVRYAETDQMGYVYYGRYAEYFEVARAEMVRDLGLPYSEMERSLGVMLPVREFSVEYLRPARYDDLLEVHCEVRQWPGVRIVFHHEVKGPTGELLVRGSVTLVFVSMETGRPTKAPEEFLQKLAVHWKENPPSEA